ncbi:MAG: PadR family transcriptional regulator, partial [Nitrososphaerota archaeon]|nr:PadR family transcriptional regulator [Nitrososphaerota archaeon]
LEKKGFIDSKWDMSCERPRKIYRLTTDGQSALNFTEESLAFICRKITFDPATEHNTAGCIC